MMEDWQFMLLCLFAMSTLLFLFVLAYIFCVTGGH